MFGLDSFWVRAPWGDLWWYGQNARVLRLRLRMDKQKQKRQKQIPARMTNKKGKDNSTATAMFWLSNGMGREAGFSAPQLTVRL